uniref:Uncharacterized protein n=1 Tax=Anas platyrhynchos platyrhynchos TaxID=8840 RepID=A0A493TI52_ANAPP
NTDTGDDFEVMNVDLATGHTFPFSTTLPIFRLAEVLHVMLTVNHLLPKLFYSTGLEMTAWIDPISSPGQARDKR